MSLCRLLVLDFTKHTGRFDGKDELYSKEDIKFGIEYAKGLLEDGHKREPFYNFNCRKFIAWCKRKLKEAK